MQQSDTLILSSINNLSQLTHSLVNLNTMLVKTRSASCASMKKPLSFSPSPFQPGLDKANYMSPTASSYFNKVKKLINSNPSLLMKRPVGICGAHNHRNCEACRMLGKNHRSRNTQRRRKVGEGGSVKKEVGREVGKQRRRAETANKIIVIKKVEEKENSRQLLEIRQELEDRLEKINSQIKQAAKSKISQSLQSFCLNSLKTSIRSQFTTLKDRSKAGPKTKENFSFEEEKS